MARLTKLCGASQALLPKCMLWHRVLGYPLLPVMGGAMGGVGASNYPLTSGYFSSFTTAPLPWQPDVTQVCCNEQRGVPSILRPAIPNRDSSHMPVENAPVQVLPRRLAHGDTILRTTIMPVGLA